MKNIMFVLTLAVLAQHAQALDSGWQGISDPDVIASGFIHNLHSLPKEGAMTYDPRAWSGYWWPSREGGINLRWNSYNRDGFSYRSPTKKELLKASAEELATLSPSEKFDVAMGRYTYPLRKTVAQSVNPNASDWDGICHGWAPASVNHDEPEIMTVKNADGIQVTFGSSDMKALLSYGYATQIDNEGTRYAGLRCNYGSWTGGANECDQDLNAGAFHIILTNELGVYHRGFVADLDRYAQIWNQPIAAYRIRSLSKTRRLSAGAAQSAVKELTVKVKVFYVNESDPSMKPVLGTIEQTFDAVDYEYTLELDSSDNIVGGKWLSEKRPDFVWTKARIQKFTGPLAGLEKLFKDRQ